MQSHARGMKIRNWMTKRHRIATTTASVFRGYVGRMGIRLKKKLKRQRAALTINQFVYEARSIQKHQFVKRDQSALQIQSFIRGFLVRWRSHHDFSTAVSLWHRGDSRASLSNQGNSQNLVTICTKTAG